MNRPRPTPRLSARIGAAISRAREALARVRKALVGVAGILAQGVAAGVLTGDSLRWAQLALATLTALGVYVAPNARKSV